MKAIKSLAYGILVASTLSLSFVSSTAAYPALPSTSTPTMYNVTQVTSNATSDSRWPSLNTQGDTVWDDNRTGFWQVFLNNSAITSGNNDHLYPDVDDSGNVVYANHGTGQNGWPPQVLEYPSGATIQFSSGNPPACTPPPDGGTCTQWRNAGDHSGIASNGTIISYYDFCNPTCVRNFSVSSGQPPGPLPTLSTDDDPDVNASGTIVYANQGTFINLVSTANPSGTIVASGNEPRINDRGTIVVIENGQVQVLFAPDYTKSAIVHTGEWADIDNNNNVIFDDLDPTTNHYQIYMATPGNGVDVSSSAGNVSDVGWQNLASAGITYAVVEGWTGCHSNGNAINQLTGAQKTQNGLTSTAGYALLNWYTATSPGCPVAGATSGASQISQAITAFGGQGSATVNNLKFIAVDVEPRYPNDEFSKWIPNHQYNVAPPGGLPDAFVDPQRHIQTVLVAGKSGPGPLPPMWHDGKGMKTIDGGVTWQDSGLVALTQSQRVALITAAVAAVPTQAVIYTSRTYWKEITGNANFGSTPLWDVQAGTGSTPTLDPFTGYAGWT
jgi:hypothetical protein